MAVEQPVEVELGTGRTYWIASATAGVLASIAFGVLAMLMMPEMMGMIGAMYGMEGNVLMGWIAHLFHGAVFGLIYAAIVSTDRLGEMASRVDHGAGLGAGYGVVVWLIAASIVMPIWLGMPEMVPDFNPVSLVGHVVYGIVLGAAYPLLVSWLR